MYSVFEVISNQFNRVKLKDNFICSLANKTFIIWNSQLMYFILIMKNYGISSYESIIVEINILLIFVPPGLRHKHRKHSKQNRYYQVF